VSNIDGIEIPSVSAFEMSLFGLRMQQNRYAPMVIDHLLEENMPKVIIELGTRTGGLTSLLGLWAYNANQSLDDKVEVISVGLFDENYPAPEHKPLMDIFEVKFMEQDVFDKETIEFLSKKISDPSKRCMVFCDAVKIEEFNLYADFLKRGDIILAHDYAHDEEEFKWIQEKGLWSFCEIRFKNIEESCKKNNLSYLNRDFTKLAAWGVFIKG
jgi:cephalosporin hydroxylase